MSSQPYAAIIGWVVAVPRWVLTNDELAQRLATSDEWIRDLHSSGEPWCSERQCL